MGNLLGRKKKVATEELETISQQMKLYKEDIERTFETKRMILWYLTLMSFFLSTSGVGYIWTTIEGKEKQILLSAAVLIFGILFLWIGRRFANMYYNWRLNKKKTALDGLLEKKKSILENVKETETFKVATEILEKYASDYPATTQSQPATPNIERKMANQPTPNPRKGESSNPMSQNPRRPMNIQPPMGPNQRLPPKQEPSIYTPMRNGRSPSIRPFHRESTSTVDKVVDYFFGDGPSNRLALICSNCHGHNGMALPHEYEYIAFVCFICSHFNPAKKLRPIPQLHAAAPLGPDSGETTIAQQQTGHGSETSSGDESTKRDIGEETRAEEDFDIVPLPSTKD